MLQRMPRFCAACSTDSLVFGRPVAATTKNADLTSSGWKERFSQEILRARAHFSTKALPSGSTTRTEAPEASRERILDSARVEAPTTRHGRPPSSTNIGNSADIGCHSLLNFGLRSAGLVEESLFQQRLCLRINYEGGKSFITLSLL